MTDIDDSDIEAVKNILESYPDVKKAIRETRELRNKLVDLCIQQHITESNFYQLSSLLTPQSRSPMWESYFIKKHSGKKIDRNENKGDMLIDGRYFEFKASCNDDNKVHIVQIRLWQDCDYIIQSIVINEFVATFELTHADMKSELELIGSTSAHGTQGANESNTNVELRMTFDIDDEHWDRWIKNYLKTKDGLS